MCTNTHTLLNRTLIAITHSTWPTVIGHPNSQPTKVTLWWVRCHNLPHTWLRPLSHHCYGTHWSSAIRISKMAKVSVSFVGYLNNTCLCLTYNPATSLNTQITHVICNHRSINTCITRRWIPWITVIPVTDFKLCRNEKLQSHADRLTV